MIREPVPAPAPLMGGRGPGTIGVSVPKVELGAAPDVGVVGVVGAAGDDEGGCAGPTADCAGVAVCAVAAAGVVRSTGLLATSAAAGATAAAGETTSGAEGCPAAGESGATGSFVGATTTSVGASTTAVSTSGVSPFLTGGFLAFETFAGSSGCASRISPSRSAFRRTRSAWASSMPEEWLLTPMPRAMLRSRASLFVSPSSFASSCTRIFAAKRFIPCVMRVGECNFGCETRFT
jgi:hypothetical protein